MELEQRALLTLSAEAREMAALRIAELDRIFERMEKEEVAEFAPLVSPANSPEVKAKTAPATEIPGFDREKLIQNAPDFQHDHFIVPLMIPPKKKDTRS